MNSKKILALLLTGLVWISSSKTAAAAVYFDSEDFDAPVFEEPDDPAAPTVVGSDIAGVSFSNGSIYFTNTSDRTAYVNAFLMRKNADDTEECWHRAYFENAGPGQKLSKDGCVPGFVMGGYGTYYLEVDLSSTPCPHGTEALSDLGQYISADFVYQKPAASLEKPVITIDKYYCVSWNPVKNADSYVVKIEKDNNRVFDTCVDNTEYPKTSIRSSMLSLGKGTYTLKVFAVSADITTVGVSDCAELEIVYDGSEIPEEPTSLDPSKLPVVDSAVAGISLQDRNLYFTNTSDQKAYLTYYLMYQPENGGESEWGWYEESEITEAGQKLSHTILSWPMHGFVDHGSGEYYLKVLISSTEEETGDLGAYRSKSISYQKPTASLAKPVLSIDQYYTMSWEPVENAGLYIGSMDKGDANIDNFCSVGNTENYIELRDVFLDNGKGKYTLRLSAVPIDILTTAWSDFTVLEIEYDGSDIPEAPGGYHEPTYNVVDQDTAGVQFLDGNIYCTNTSSEKAYLNAFLMYKETAESQPVCVGRNYFENVEPGQTMTGKSFTLSTKDYCNSGIYYLLVEASSIACPPGTESLGDLTEYCSEEFVYQKPIAKPVTGISLSKESLEMAEGDQVILTATVQPSDADNKNVIWSSSEETIATVKNGVVTAIAEGTAIITAASTDTGNISAKCSVTVAKKKIPLASAVLTSAITLKSGDSCDLTPELYPANATNVEVVWSSSKSDVATVSNGKISAKSAGTAVIKATVTGEGGFKKDLKCTVTVKDATKEIKVTKVAINRSKAGMGIGTTIKLTAGVVPDIADDTELTWAIVSGTDCVDIAPSGGECLITAKKTGKAVVSATNTKYNKTAKCTITVGNPLASITLSGSKTLAAGKSTTIKATLKDSAGKKPSNTALIWSLVDGEEHAILDAKGKLTGISAGMVTVRAASTESTGETQVSAEYQVEIVIPIKKLVISEKKSVIEQFYRRENETGTATYIGRVGNLKVSTVEPNNASNTRITWKSNNDVLMLGVRSANGANQFDNHATYGNSVEVDLAKGESLIYLTNPAKPGKATLTGTTNDGSKKTVKCTVTVKGNVKAEDVKISIKKVPRGITVSDNDSQEVTVTGLKVNKSVSLSPVVTATAANKKVTFTSSDPTVATVTSKGKVKGLKSGQAIITMQTEDGGYEARCIVNVEN